MVAQVQGTLVSPVEANGTLGSPSDRGVARAVTVRDLVGSRVWEIWPERGRKYAAII